MRYLAPHTPVRSARLWAVAFSLLLLFTSLSNLTPTAAQPKPATFYTHLPSIPLPPRGHLNSFTLDSIPSALGAFADLVELPLAFYLWETTEWHGLLADKWEYLDKAKLNWRVTLRADVQWSDQQLISAKDVTTTFSVLRLRNSPDMANIASVAAKDEHTILFTFKQASTITERYIMRQRIRPDSVYGQFAADTEQLITDNQSAYDEGKLQKSEAWQTLAKQLNDFHPEAVIASGPYSFGLADIIEDSVTLRRNDASVYTRQAPYESIVIYRADIQAILPKLLDGSVTYSPSLLRLEEEQALDKAGAAILRSPSYYGPALYFNHALPPFNHVAFRQALAYALDRDAIKTAAVGNSGQVVELLTGLSDTLNAAWLNEGTRVAINPYKRDTNTADQLFLQAGLIKHKSGKAWLGADGKQQFIEITVPAEFVDWVAAAEQVGAQLQELGFGVNVRRMSNAEQLDNMAVGQFQMAVRMWGLSSPYPFNAFRNEFYAINGPGLAKNRPGMSYPLQQTVRNEVVDIAEQLPRTLSADHEEASNAASQIAWAFNSSLPMLPLYERYANMPIWADQVDLQDIPSQWFHNWPGLGGDNYIVLCLIEGKITPKQK